MKAMVTRKDLRLIVIVKQNENQIGIMKEVPRRDIIHTMVQ